LQDLYAKKVLVEPPKKIAPAPTPAPRSSHASDFLSGVLGGSGGGGGGGGGGGDDDRKPPPKKREDDEPAKAPFKKIEGGSAWPVPQCRLSADRVKIVQAKMNASRGLDKGCCAACLLGEDGCDEDSRAGVMGKCGWAHQGPKGQEAQFCVDVAATAGLKVPYVARNFKFW